MKEGFSSEPASEPTPEVRPIVQTETEKKITREQLAEKKEKLISTLQNIRLNSPDWRSTKGKSRDEMIAALEAAIVEVDEKIESYVEEEGVFEPASETFKQKLGSEKKVEESRQSVQTGHYLTIGNVHVPICQPPQDNPEWNAVPGKVFVSGGKKFSEVRFVKDAHGLTHVAKPGELMGFSEKHRGQRLESVDAILEGRGEMKVFNEVLTQLGELTRQYGDLNPDEADYDEKAKQLSAQIGEFTDSEKLKELFKANESGIEDFDGFVERVADIIRTQQFLRSIDESSNEFIPPRDTHFKLTPYFERKFAQFATLLNRQLGIGNNSYLEDLVKNKKAPEWEKLTAKGMTVIVGPRGTGKNKLADFYCGETNRPLFRYACSPDKEERDLTYDVELSDGEVVKIPTRILTAVTTPNAVLELDELNLLRPNVAKFFNSLFDGDRTVFLNDQTIKAAPGVVFVGLMNPAEYDGVEDLPETIDDRSNIMAMGYPPFKEINPANNQEKFTYDEALILKEHISPLKDLSDEQFTKAWNYVVNGTGAQISLDVTTVKIIKDLKNIVAIADKTRQVAEAYKTRTGDTRLNRDISLRGSIDAARIYSENHLWKTDLSKMPGWKAGWNAAQYAIATAYMPHTETYKRGKVDRDAMMLILAESIK